MLIEDLTRKVTQLEIIYNELKLKQLQIEIETQIDKIDLISSAILRKEAASLRVPQKYIDNPSLLHPTIDINAGIFYEITVHKSNIINTNFVLPSNTIHYQRSQKENYYCFMTYFKNNNGTMVSTSGTVTKYYRPIITADNTIDVEEIFC